jgi:hypothetical protein
MSARGDSLLVGLSCLIELRELLSCVRELNYVRIR